MPIAITLRRDFAASYYRDAFVRALSSPNIDAAFVASGFFLDFTGKLQDSAPDFGIGEEMLGKEVFLFGSYKEDASRLRELRDALAVRGLKAYAHRLEQPEVSGLELRWHAKVAIFLSERRPVLAIVGSSNLTGPSMYGASEHRFIADPGCIQVEGDSFYWLRGDVDASQTMHDVFHYWGSGSLAPKIAFNHEKFDSEIEILIESLYRDLLRFPWCML